MRQTLAALAGAAVWAAIATAPPAPDNRALAFFPGDCITDIECDTLHGPDDTWTATETSLRKLDISLD